MDCLHLCVCVNLHAAMCLCACNSSSVCIPGSALSCVCVYTSVFQHPQSCLRGENLQKASGKESQNKEGNLASSDASCVHPL